MFGSISSCGCWKIRIRPGVNFFSESRKCPTPSKCYALSGLPPTELVPYLPICTHNLTTRWHGLGVPPRISSRSTAVVELLRSASLLSRFQATLAGISVSGVWRRPARLCSRERDRLPLDVAAAARVGLPVVHVDAVGLELLVPVPQGQRRAGTGTGTPRMAAVRGGGESGLQERRVVLPVCKGALLR